MGRSARAARFRRLGRLTRGGWPGSQRHGTYVDALCKSYNGNTSPSALRPNPFTFSSLPCLLQSSSAFFVLILCFQFRATLFSHWLGLRFTWIPSWCRFGFIAAPSPCHLHFQPTRIHSSALRNHCSLVLGALASWVGYYFWIRSRPQHVESKFHFVQTNILGRYQLA